MNEHLAKHVYRDPIVAMAYAHLADLREAAEHHRQQRDQTINRPYRRIDSARR